MLCAFGLAPKQHTDDALRGVLSALGMIEHIENDLKLMGSKASVSSGSCFTGSVGIKQCRRFVILGEAVNISDRNLDSIKDGVINDKATRDAIGDAIPQFPVGQDTFRPYDKNETTSRYIRALDMLHKHRRKHQLRIAPSPMYKDSKVCAEFTKHIVSWISSSPKQARVIVVEGPIGCGKSEIISHCLHESAKTQRSTRVLYTYADDFKNHQPFSGWANVVKEFLVKSQGEENKKSQIEAMFGLLAPYAQMRRALPLLNNLLDLNMPLTSECWDARKSPEMTECTKRVLFYCLISEIMKQKDTIVAVDDAMYFDEMSWSMINDLKTGAQSLMANYSEFPSFAVKFLTEAVKVPSSFVLIFGMRPIHQHESTVSGSVLAEYDYILEEASTSVVKISKLQSEAIKKGFLYHLQKEGVKNALDCSEGTLNCIVDLCGGSAYIIREVARTMVSTNPSVLSISGSGVVSLVKSFRAVSRV